MTYLVRMAQPTDAADLFPLVRDFATSFEPSREAFDVSFGQLQEDESAWLGVTQAGSELIGYLLGFVHPTFFANGPVAWIEEVMVREDWRKQGIGRALTVEFERWAKVRGSKLVALATRRAAPFYLAIGYEESATYFRKVL